MVVISAARLCRVGLEAFATKIPTKVPAPNRNNPTSSQSFVVMLDATFPNLFVEQIGISSAASDCAEVHQYPPGLRDGVKVLKILQLRV